MTPRWRKGDSNRWSHLRRRRWSEHLIRRSGTAPVWSKIGSGRRPEGSALRQDWRRRSGAQGFRNVSSSCCKFEPLGGLPHPPMIMRDAVWVRPRWANASLAALQPSGDYRLERRLPTRWPVGGRLRLDQSRRRTGARHRRLRNHRWRGGQSVQFSIAASCVAEAVAAHPPRKLVLFDGKIVARDGSFAAALIPITSGVLI